MLFVSGQRFKTPSLALGVEVPTSWVTGNQEGKDYQENKNSQTTGQL